MESGAFPKWRNTSLVFGWSVVVLVSGSLGIALMIKHLLGTYLRGFSDTTLGQSAALAEAVVLWIVLALIWWRIIGYCVRCLLPYAES